MKSRFMLLLFLAALLPIAAGCGDKPAYGTIKGVVLGPDNVGLSGVKVTACKTADQSVVKSTVSTASGEFFFYNLEAGLAVDVKFSKDGFIPTSEPGILLEKGEIYQFTKGMSTEVDTVTILGTVIFNEP